MRTTMPTVLTVVLAALVTTGASHASAPSMGPLLELSAAPHDQHRPAIAYDDMNDQYLMVWDQLDGSGSSQIVGRFINADGVSTGVDFTISEDTDDARNPDVVYDPSHDRFIVVWDRDHQNQGVDHDLLGRFVPHNGPDSGLTTFVVDTTVANTHHPSIAIGRYEDLDVPNLVVIACQTDHASLPSAIDRIVLRADGSVLEAMSEVASSTETDFIRPVAVHAPEISRFVVAYESVYSAADHDIFAAFLSSTGIVNTPAFPVADANHNEVQPDVVECGGRYHFVWSGDSNGYEVWTRPVSHIYDVGPRVRVNTSGNAFVAGESQPALACRPDAEDILVVWQTAFSIQSEHAVWANVVDAAGQAATVFAPGFDAVITGDRTRPALAIGGDRAMAVWQNRSGEFDFQDLEGRWIQLNLFSDGFETGDDSEWSASTP